MSVPAPPPPPPPPPAAFKSLPIGGGGGGGGPNALLKDIRHGAKLKKTVTNDRSAPVCGGNSTSANNNNFTSLPTQRAPSSRPQSEVPTGGPIGFGGMFQNGFPSLKPVNGRSKPAHLPTKPAVTNAANSFPSRGKTVAPPPPPSPSKKPTFGNASANHSSPPSANHSGPPLATHNGPLSARHPAIKVPASGPMVSKAPPPPPAWKKSAPTPPSPSPYENDRQTPAAHFQQPQQQPKLTRAISEYLESSRHIQSVSTSSVQRKKPALDRTESETSSTNSTRRVSISRRSSFLEAVGAEASHPHVAPYQPSSQTNGPPSLPARPARRPSKVNGSHGPAPSGPASMLGSRPLPPPPISTTPPTSAAPLPPQRRAVPATPTRPLSQNGMGQLFQNSNGPPLPPPVNKRPTTNGPPPPPSPRQQPGLMPLLRPTSVTSPSMRSSTSANHFRQFSSDEDSLMEEFEGRFRFHPEKAFPPPRAFIKSTKVYPSAKRESDLMRIRSENQKLQEELTQALSDKEFVWSLWKRLQVSSPDMTQAISLVIQREKEKNEAKDEKVLQILKLKDAKLAEVQNIITKQSEELSSLVQQKAGHLDNIKRLEADVVNLSDRGRSVEKERLGRDDRERQLEEGHRRTVDAYENVKRELSERVTLLQTELTRVKSENGDMLAARILHENRSKALEEELAHHRGTTSQTASITQTLNLLQDEVDQLRESASHHSQEQVSLRHQLAQAEERTREYRQVARDLQRTTAALEGRLADYEGLYGRLRRRSEGAGGMASVRFSEGRCASLEELSTTVSDEEDDSGRVVSPVVDLNYKVQRLESQVTLLRDCLKQKDECVPSTVNWQPQRHQRARSQPPSSGGGAGKRCFALEALKRKTAFLTQKLARMDKTLEEKEVDLTTTKQAAAKSSDRLVTLQAAHRSLKEQFRDLDNECSQWKIELESKDRAFEDKANQLKEEKCRNRELAEEIQALQDRLHMDNSKIHEYAMALDQAREHFERSSDERRRRAPSIEIDDRMRQLRNELEEVMLKNDHLETEMQTLRQESYQFSSFQGAFESEKRGLKSELQLVTEELSQKKLEIAHLKRRLGSSHDHSIPVRSYRRPPCRLPSPRTPTTSTTLTSTSRPTTALLGQLVTSSEPDDQWEDVEEEDVLSAGCNWIPASRHHQCITDSDRSSLGAHIARSAASGVRGVTMYPKCTGGGGGGALHSARRRQMKLRGKLGRGFAYTSVGNRGTVAKDNRDDLDRVPTRDNGLDSHIQLADRECDIGGEVALAAKVMHVPQSVILKGRVASLQQQLAAYRKFRVQTGASITSLQNKNKALQRDLDQANSRAKRFKNTIERLQTDCGAMNHSRPFRALANEDFAAGEIDIADSSKLHLESMPRDPASEVIGQAAVIRNLRTELEVKEEHLNELRERLTRSDRDAAAKRRLLEDLRERVKATQVVTQSDKEALVDNEDRLVGYKELLDRQKAQLESAKTRLTTAMEERRRYESELSASREECDKRGRQLGEARNKRADLERVLAEVERSGRERLAGLVEKSATAVDVAGEKLTLAQKRGSQFEELVVTLAQLVQNTLAEIQGLASRGNNRHLSPSKMDSYDDASEVSNRCLAQAKGRAADILNLTPRDLEDLLHPSHLGHVKRGKGAEEKCVIVKGSSNWPAKCRKVMRKEDFVIHLQQQFDSRLDEIVNLVKMS